MKKIILILALIIGGYSIMTVNAKEDIVVPENTIRFRIIADSNNAEDQLIKIKIKEQIMNVLSKIQKGENIETTRKNIKQNIPELETEIQKIMKENNYNKEFNINYGINHFPEKKYKGIKYPEGDYESLIIEIGKAKGNNFWCLLYPPLCLIDENEYSKEDYKLFIKEVLKKFND